MSQLINEDFIWVDTDAQLAECCQHWAGKAALAVDTEFMRSSTFFPIMGLLQINDGEQNYLIDPLAVNELGPLQALWQNTAVIKVLHSCSEDMEVFQTWLGCLPQPMFDTQIAAAFAGLGFSMGYGNLVKASLGVELEKGETRSDWLRRPLSQSQQHYAALDVAYLLVVYEKLLLELKQRDRLAWVQADCDSLLQQYLKPAPLELAYLKQRSGWKLRRPQLAVLQQLCLWREHQARARDIPRNRLIKDGSLFQMAMKLPSQFKALAAIEDMQGRTLRENGTELLEIIQSAQDDEVNWPESLPKPLSVGEGKLLKVLKDRARQAALQQDIPVELLLSKKEYEALVRGAKQVQPELPAKLQGWREAVIAKVLLQAIKDYD